MLLEFIAIIAGGFGLAGLAMTLNFLVGKRLPGWTVPAAAGAGMLAMAVWLEYSWLDRATSSYPDGVEIASTHQTRSWYRPWTYVVPLTNRLIAIDHRFDRRNPAHPDMVLTQMVLAGRWEPTREFGAMFDCARHRRADLLDQVRFADDGTLEDADWHVLDPADPVLQTACGR